jgi:hypothetical protein
MKTGCPRKKYIGSGRDRKDEDIQHPSRTLEGLFIDRQRQSPPGRDRIEEVIRVGALGGIRVP